MFRCRVETTFQVVINSTQWMSIHDQPQTFENKSTRLLGLILYMSQMMPEGNNIPGCYQLCTAAANNQLDQGGAENYEC